MRQDTVLRFLRFIPIPENFPAATWEFLNREVPLPDFLERPLTNILGISSAGEKPEKGTRTKPRLKTASPSRQPRLPIIEGQVGHGITTLYSVAGRDILISEDTWIFGELRAGIKAQVHGLPDYHGVIEAQKIVVL